MNYLLRTRVLAMLLAVVMLIGLVPTSVFATETEGTTVTVTFNVNGGTGEYEDQVVTVGDKVAKPEQDPTHDTATFAYWTADLEANEEWDFEEDVVAEAMTLYATWITPAAETEPQSTETEPQSTETEPQSTETEPQSTETEPEETESQETEPTTAVYTVEHYLETAEGYELDGAATETLTGEIGAATAAVAKEYDGYTAQSFEQGVVAEDGSVVIKIYYKKNPVVAAATANGLPSNMSMVSDKKSTLAPGIVERQITAYDKNGDRVLMYVATADLDVETVEVYANYQNNVAPPWGMQKTTDQAAAFEANHEGKKTIVAINASYFNTGTGQPTGAFAMEGTLINNDTQGNNYSFFAILKDGTAMIGAKGEYTAYKDQIQEAIGGYIHLVKDGAICSGLNTVEKYPRQTIGVTADGQVIIMTADCLAAVGSAGLTVQEQAEVMLAMGCVEAVHLDGGGSGTYCSRPVGSDNLVVTSNPSNGTERAVSNTLILVSTAKADGEFDSAVLTAEHEYVTPGSVVNVSAVGLDASKGPAEIPADAIWQLSDSTLGTVENGVFTSNGTVGSAVVQMVYDDKVVGSTTVEVVIPDTLNFGGQESIIIPYGKSVDLPVKATYDGNEVFYNVSDLTITLADESATVDGLTVTAPAADSGVASTSVMVCLKTDATVAASATLVFGKGSEVIFDFENGTDGANLNNWIVRTHETTNGNYNEQGEIYIVDKNSGMVHDGEQALAFHADFSQSTRSGSNTAGYIALSLTWDGEAVDIAGAKSVGFWLYVPEDAMTTEVTLNTVYYVGDSLTGRRTVDCFDDNGELIYTPYWGTKMEGSGWHYVRADLSGYTDDLLIKDAPLLSGAYKRNYFIKIFCVSGEGSTAFPGFQGDFTYYIDNITVDYSDAVEDRELPVFSAAYVNAGALDNVALSYGKTVSVASGEVSFTANVTDNTGMTNYTGINAATAKVYVDGNAVGASYANGMISSAGVNLPDGYHTVRFEIADNNGNVGYITRAINVNAGSEKPTVKLVPHDVSLTRLLSGSVYWVDLVSDDIANIDTINTVLNLDSTNEWELAHMVVADGFDVSYSSSAAQAAENNVSLTITRNGEAIDTDSNVIVSIPIRVWESLLHTFSAHSTRTPASQWTNGAIDIQAVIVKVDKGVVTFADNTKSYFSDRIDVEHEAYTSYYAMDKTYHASRSYHVHTAAAMDDVAATCTENGYTSRTFCEVCNSVVAWGTTQKATGHSYVLTDGVAKCTCGDLLTGILDGIEYTNGIALTGWVGESYYVDGVKLTGVHKVTAPDSEDEFYYDFGEDGICENHAKYDGLFLDADTGVYRYAKIGVVSSGWYLIGEDWYYFDAATMAAATGSTKVGDVTYVFEETGKLTSGVWAETLYGTRYYYGPGCYYNGWQTIDGKVYCFAEYVRLENGYYTVRENMRYSYWHYFDENGVCDKDAIVPDGFYSNEIGMGYSRNGAALTGVQVIDGERYSFDYLGYAQKGYVNDCYFGDDYKGITGVRKVGSALRYFNHGKSEMAGLVEVDGAYYFAKDSKGTCVTGEYYVWEPNGIVEKGNYEFGEDGKMLDGIVEKNGTYYYYEMGQGKMAGLVEVDGDYYFAKDGKGTCVTGEYYVWEPNGIVEKGNYEFGPDGKMLNGIIERDGGYYYYEMGQSKMAGLVEVDGAYYFAKDNKGTCVTGKYYVWAPNGLVERGTYEFGQDGKMLRAVIHRDGNYYYYEMGQSKMAGLVEVDGDYYFAKDSKGTCVTGVYYVWAPNGIVEKGNYEFGEDGKMLDGIVEKDGTYHYYEMGQSKMAGLVEVDGDYYFAKDSKGTCVTGEYYVWAPNGIVEKGNYEFGEDGKLLDGIVEKNGTYYYYEMGQSKMAGLVEVDGAYYFAKDNKGTCVTGKYYVWAPNDLVEKGTYEFGQDGKMLDGFVTKDDGIYYYENGVPGTVGLNYIDGYYYFIEYGGKLITNRVYYVWETNGLSIKMNYKFDELGRAVL